MSAHYDLPANVPPTPEMIEQGFPLHDNHYNPYSRLSGPPSHYDAVAFWYRPDYPEPLYDPNPGVYGTTMSISPPQIDTTSVKHRRTRSGCYTCRSRRVKCDETRPICERCKKGGRECEFPQTTSSASSKRSKQSEPKSPQQTSRAKGKGGDGKSGPPVLETIQDDAEAAAAAAAAAAAVADGQPAKPARRPTLSRSRTHSTQSLSRKQRHRSQTDISSPPLKEKASPQSSTSSSSHSYPATPTSLPSYNGNTAAAEAQARQAKIKALKPEIQKYLDFQRDHMTHYHYFFKLDPTDFIHTEFIDLALSYEPLLYAVVGFAAYHHALRQPDASLVHFLHFYSKALVLLRKSLEKQAEYSEAMLLAVLQLATVEEYLGDWVNLVGHHKAGYTMLTSLFAQPETMMTTELGRRIFSWFARFDLISGLMAGGSPRLDRRWFEANEAWYAAAVDDDLENDVDIDGILGSYVATNQLVGFDMARLFARMQQMQAAAAAAASSSSTAAGPDVSDPGNQQQQQKQESSTFSQPSSSSTTPSFSPSGSASSSSTSYGYGGGITLEQFHAEHASILDRLGKMKSRLESLNDGFFTVTSFPAARTRPYDPAVDIVNPYIPGGLFKDALWNLNFMWIDWYAIEQMHQHQVALLLQQPLPVQKLGALSLQQCRIYEAIDRYPDAPEGAILGAHASLGLATVFLKKDEKHIMWARRKLADIERLGYVFPERYRKQMALMWGLSRDQRLPGDESDDSNSVEDWWLPNREGMLPILQEIRRVVSERHAMVGGGGDSSGDGVVDGSASGIGGGNVGPGDQGEGTDKMIPTAGRLQDVRDLKAIFARLDLQSQAAARAAEAAAAAAAENATSTTTAAAAAAGDAPAEHEPITNASIYDELNTDADDADICYEDGNSHGQDRDRGSRMSGIWS